MNENEAQVPAWFKETFESIGSQFVSKGTEVAAETPWGAGYQPKRMADMNVTQREEAQSMLDRYKSDPDYGETDATNGTKVITHLPSGFAINSDNFMLTANAEGKHEVASMFDIGMMTGELTRGKAEMDAQRQVLNYKPTTAEPMAPATKEETDMGKAMLEVDQSGATPPTGGKAPGAPTASTTTPTGAMPKDTVSFAGKSFASQDYDVGKLEKHVAEKAVSDMTPLLVAQGYKPGTPEFNQQISDNMAGYAEHIANSFYKNAPAPTNVTTDPAKAQAEVLGAEPKVDKGPAQHWEDSTTKKSEYNREFTNKEDYSQNYGKYTGRDQYLRSLKNTIKTLETSGKRTAKDDALLADFDGNQKKYYDLGIATTSELARYKADMKHADKKRDSMESSAYRKAEKDAKKQQFIDEAATKVDQRIDSGESPLDVTDHFTPSLARKINSKRPEQTNQEKQRYTAMIDTAANVQRIHTHLKDADLRALETVSPKERAKAFIGKYFGDLTPGQLKAKYASMGMNELVSKTVKQISGAAASDQERAFIRSWMMGEEGVSGEVVIQIMNKIRRDTYDQASRYGQELYDNSDFGRLHNLSKATRGIKPPDVDEEMINQAVAAHKPGKIQRVNTPGTPRNR